MNSEETQRLATLVTQTLQDSLLSEAEITHQVRALHADERVLGAAIWASRKTHATPLTASAWFIQCMGQAGAQSYDIGDFQRLLTDLGARPDLGGLAVSGGLVWNHSLESLAEKMGRELLLVDIDILAPTVRQAFVFFMMRAGLVSATDVSSDDVDPLFEALITGWQDAQDFSRDWMRRAPSPEVGHFMARALSSVAWTRAEPIAFAVPFVRPDEAVRIAANMKDMEHASVVIEMLDSQSDQVFLALNGRALPWYDRMFGPTPQSWLFGVTGLIGPPGIIGVIVSLAAYQTAGHLGLFWMVIIILAVAAIVRFFIQKPVPPQFFPRDLEAARPGASAVLAAWYIRQRRIRKLPDPAIWVETLRQGVTDQSESWRPFLIAVSDLLPPALEPTVLSGPSEASDPVQLFNTLEFGAAEARSTAHDRLLKFGRKPSEVLDRWLAEAPTDDDLRTTFIRHLENSWLTQRRISPTNFRETWASKSLWAVSSRCLFGVYNGYNELVFAFRIDETGQLIDQADQEIVIPGYHTIGLVEPDALSPSDSTLWASVFADYELISPFEQLHNIPVQLPITLNESAQKSLTQAGWLLDEDGFSLRRPVWILGITAYIEVDPPLSDFGQSQLTAFDFADGLHFEPESVVTFLRADQDIDRLTPFWLGELQRLAGL